MEEQQILNSRELEWTRQCLAYFECTYHSTLFYSPIDELFHWILVESLERRCSLENDELTHL